MSSASGDRCFRTLTGNGRTLTLTLTLMIQDSGPSNHRTMFRFSKLKLIGFGGMGMVPIRSFVTKTGIGLGGAKQIVNVTI